MSDLEEKIASELVEQTVGALAAPAALPAQVIGEAIAGHLKGLRWIKQGRLKYKREDVEIDKLIAKAVLSLEEKIGTISQERFQTPELQVYGPAVNALSYTIEDENLREMFTNLLTKAMDSETINVALPAYTEIIKQLSSDEAKILNALADDINFSESRAGESKGFLGYRLQGGFPMWPLVQRLRRNEDSTAFSLEKDNVVDFNITLDKEDFLPVYVSNFERLGIISIDYENPVRQKGMNVVDGKFLGYEELDLYSDLTEKALAGEFGDFTSPDKTEYLVKKGHFKLTNFGIQFIFTVIFPVDGKFSKMYPDSPSNSE